MKIMHTQIIATDSNRMFYECTFDDGSLWRYHLDEGVKNEEKWVKIVPSNGELEKHFKKYAFLKKT